MTSVVLVTGGAGFIGSHVVDHLEAAGHRPRILDARPSPWHSSDRVETVIGDVRRLDDVLRAVRGCDAVCHLAAAADVGEVHKQPAESTEVNSLGTLNVLEAARRENVRRVLYASTVWVYSAVDADVVDEETLLPGPAHIYTAAKLSGELFCNSYAELYGLQPTILRFGIPYGPRSRPAAVIPSFVDRALRGEPLTIAGSGEQERSFVYVEDLAAGVVAALAPAAGGRTYNLAGRETTTVRGLAELVCDVVGPTEIVHTDARAADLRGQTVCNDRAERELDWRPTTTLRDGVRRYVAWLREQQGAADVAIVPRRRTIAGQTVRRTAGRLITAAADPTYVGGAALIAVASAAASADLGTSEDAQAGALTVIALGLMLPLWSLTLASWPAGLRRLQAALAALVGVSSVGVLGVLSAGPVVDIDGKGVLLILVACASLASALSIMPRRLSGDSI